MDILIILLLAFFGSIIALLGGVIFLFNKKWSSSLEKRSVPFAAGVLLAISLIGLLPEAMDILGEKALVIVLLTFAAVYVFENICFQVHHHENQHCRINYKSAIPLVLIGDTIHNFIDGVAIASSYLISPGLGLITALSTFLHEVPHEIADFGILLSAGWTKKNILLINILSACATIIGALFVVLFLREDSFIGILLAVSAGIFLYLGASDFVPQIEHERKKPIISISFFLLGIFIMLFVLNLISHS